MLFCRAVRIAVYSEHHRIQLHHHVVRALPEHELRDPARNPRSQRPIRTSSKAAARAGPVWIRVQCLCCAVDCRHGRACVFPTTAANLGRIDELYICGNGWSFSRIYGVLVLDRPEAV